jgi:mRNA interferase MazF
VELSRGALVTVALQGDHGKPRPALVIQSDLFAGTATVVVLLISSTLVETPLGRVTVEPTEANGLRAASQVMVDKPIAVPVRKIGPAFGRLDDAALLEVSRALALFLGIAR